MFLVSNSEIVNQKNADYENVYNNAFFNDVSKSCFSETSSRIFNHFII